MYKGLKNLPFKYVLVVGCDKTGKSTVIAGVVENMAAIAAEFEGATYATWKGVKPDSTNQAIQVATRLLDSTDWIHAQPLILDRFNIPDEAIYAQALDLPMTEQQIEDLDYLHRRFMNNRIGIIYCDADTDEIKSRFASENEKDVPVKAIDNIKKGYVAWLNKVASDVPIVHLNSTHQTEEEMLNDALAFVTGKEQFKEVPIND